MSLHHWSLSARGKTSARVELLVRKEGALVETLQTAEGAEAQTAIMSWNTPPLRIQFRRFRKIRGTLFWGPYNGSYLEVHG